MCKTQMHVSTHVAFFYPPQMLASFIHESQQLTLNDRLLADLHHLSWVKFIIIIVANFTSKRLTRSGVGRF